MRFANPFLLFLLPVALFILLYLKKKEKSATVSYSDIEPIRVVAPVDNSKKRLFFLRVLIISLIILGLARPQKGLKDEEILTKGIDIILVIDTSTSMRAEDFSPQNRLDAAKEAAKNFVKGRKNDRIGVVVFSAISFTQCPLTLDYSAVLDFLDKVEIRMTETDGTAIGGAIATSVNRLKDSTAKSKVIILLTDGRNNMGEIDPLTASRAAGAFGIKIYTIGAGVPGGALYPVDGGMFGKRYVRLPEELDEQSLKNIAELTGGEYFRADSRERLKRIYSQIDKLEKTELKVKEYMDYTELFPYFALPAFILFIFEIFIRETVLRKIP